jgi:hypothetical protein
MKSIFDPDSLFQYSPLPDDENYFAALSGVSPSKVPRYDYVREFQRFDPYLQQDITNLPTGPIYYQVSLATILN